MINLFRHTTLIILLITASLCAQQAIDARAAAMAYSNGAAAYGLENVGLNPAGLALRKNFNFEFTLLGVNAGFRNNSFNKDDYENYFASGRLLSGQDIEDILNKIPERGLRGDGVARASTLSFYIPNFSISLTGNGIGKLNVPKAAFDIPLNGNSGEGRVYDLGDSDVNGWGSIDITVSGAYPLHFEEGSTLDFLAIGASFKYISGLFFGDVIESRGTLTDFDLANNRPFFELDGAIEVQSAEGGSGFGLDFGMVATVNERFNVGLTIQNPVSNINWTTDPETRLYALKGDSLSLPDQLTDSLVTETDTLLNTNEFSTKLPLVIDLALAYQTSPNLLLTAQYEQGLNDNMGGTKRPRVAAGIEYTGIPFLPLRAGINVGGKIGRSLAIGGGLDFKYWYLNLAYISHGTFLPGDYTRSSVSLTTRLRF